MIHFIRNELLIKPSLLKIDIFQWSVLFPLVKLLDGSTESYKILSAYLILKVVGGKLCKKFVSNLKF